MYTIFLWRYDSFFGDGYEPVSSGYVEIANNRQYLLQNIDKILLGMILSEQEHLIIDEDFYINDLSREEACLYAKQCEKILRESALFRDASIEINWEWPSEEYENAYISFSIENFDPLSALKDS